MTYAAWAEEAALIAEACLLAGRADWIPRMLRTGSLDDCRRLLAAPDGPAGEVPSQPDDLALVSAARFEAYRRRLP